MASDKVECVVRLQSNLGEGALWHEGEQRLYWIDLLAPAVYRFDPRTGRNETLRADIGSYIGGMVFRAKGGWIVVKEDGISAVDAVSGKRQWLLNPEAGVANNWFNDCKCDRQGRLWTGTADRGEKEPSGNLYVIDKGLTAKKIDSGIICSNGPAFSPDGRTAYFADSVARAIYRYAIDPATGSVGPRQPFARIAEPDGVPDGMTVDADGFLWNAHWDGGRVTRYAPDGRIDRVVRVPAPRVTSVGFGGAGYRTLYITTASNGLSESQLAEAPLSGGVFACEPGVAGLAEPDFIG